MHIKIQHKLELQCVERACKEWLVVDPEEVKTYFIYMRQKADELVATGTGGHTPLGMMIESMMPSFVMLRASQLLRQLGWEPEAARNWDREPGSRGMVNSKLFNAAVKWLLPEANPATRKEQRQLYYKGWKAGT